MVLLVVRWRSWIESLPNAPQTSRKILGKSTSTSPNIHLNIPKIRLQNLPESTPRHSKIEVWRGLLFKLRFCQVLGAAWGRLGGVLGPSWASWERLGAVLGCLGSVFGRLGAVLGRPGGVLGRIALLIRFENDLKSIWTPKMNPSDPQKSLNFIGFTAVFNFKRFLR